MTATTPAYDFAAALDAQAETPFGTHRQGGIEIQRINETIRFALKLAAKVMQEPSVAAIDHAKAEYKTLEKACNEVGERLSWEGGAITVFTAMISQACLEVENGE